MPRYFFHVLNDTFRTDDHVGAEFADLAAACHHARTAAGQILAEEIVTRSATIHLTVMIDDDRGLRVATVAIVTTTDSTDCPSRP